MAEGTTDGRVTPVAGDAWSEDDRLLQDLVELRRSFEEVTETACSPDGLVCATVGAHGELTELSLDPRIYRTTDSKALAETITATIREAVAAATARMAELTKPFLPDGVDLFDPGAGDDPFLAFGPASRRLDNQLHPDAR